MEINKQLFENVLSGKLKGTFVLRGEYAYSSAGLNRNYGKFRYTHPYMIDSGSYTPEGIFSIDGVKTNFDIIDFIPETNMKEEKRNVELTLEKAKEWYKKGGELREVALQAFTEKELKDTKPRSWEEYCKQHSTTVTECYFLDNEANVRVFGWHPNVPSDHYRNTLPSKELTEAFRAMMQLMSVRQDWIHKWSLERGLTKDWEPDWESPYAKYCIYPEAFYLKVHYNMTCARPLSFPTEEMAEDFMNCFKDLLEVAEQLI